MKIMNDTRVPAAQPNIAECRQRPRRNVEVRQTYDIRLRHAAPENSSVSCSELPSKSAHLRTERALPAVAAAHHSENPERPTRIAYCLTRSGTLTLRGG